MGSDIKDIKAAHSLVNAVSAEGHTLEYRQGKWWACCPFHVEKSPSFCISDEKYRCFSCGAQGDIIDWTMNTLGCSLYEAVQHLKGGFTPNKNQPQAGGQIKFQGDPEDRKKRMQELFPYAKVVRFLTYRSIPRWVMTIAHINCVPLFDRGDTLEAIRKLYGFAPGFGGEIDALVMWEHLYEEFKASGL